MTHRQIGVGETSSYRYIGVEPPLTDFQSQGILKRVALPNWTIQLNYQSLSEPDTTVPYTEFYLDAGDALDVLGREKVDTDMMRLAQSIGELLVESGDVIEVFDIIITTDYDHPIFGKEADMEREMLAHIRDRRRV